MKKRPSPLILMLCLFLVGCGPQVPPALPSASPPSTTATPVLSEAPPTPTLIPTAPLGEIAFLAFNATDQSSDIVTTQVESNHTSPVPNTAGAAAVAWSPDGKRLAFTIHHNDSEWTLNVVNADGSHVLQITGGNLDHFPNWSPDGSQITFSRNGNLWVMRISNDEKASTSDFRQLTNDPHQYVSAPAWSPDGSQIVFASQAGDPLGTASYNDPSTAEIYSIHTDGTNLRKLTDNRYSDGGPCWSPDGKLIAFASNQSGKFQIYTMDAEGSNLQRLTNDNANDVNPAWSPDGKQIAFSSDRDSNFDIYVMNTNSSSQTRLEQLPTQDWSPAWKLHE